jgi:hypothetical protein
VSSAGGAGFGLGACFGAGARTGFAADRDRNGQCGCFTVEGIFQRDFDSPESIVARRDSVIEMIVRFVRR